MPEYTDYCTCFYDEEYGEVIFWDEISDRKIEAKKVKDKTEAKELMLQYVEGAPPDVICQSLDYKYL